MNVVSRLLLLVLASLGVLPSPTAAQQALPVISSVLPASDDPSDFPNYTQGGDFDGAVLATTYSDSFGGPGDSRALRLIDLSDPTSPLVVADIPLPMTVDIYTPLQFEDGVVWMRSTDGDGRAIQPIDVRDPSNPIYLPLIEFRGSNGLVSQFQRFVVRDGLLYARLATETAIVDVGDPTMPSELSRYSFPGDLQPPFIEVADDRVFGIVGNSQTVSTLFILSTSDPSTPVLVSQTHFPNGRLSFGSSRGTTDADIADGILFARLIDTVPSGIAAIDIADEMAPSIVAVFPAVTFVVRRNSTVLGFGSPTVFEWDGVSPPVPRTTFEFGAGIPQFALPVVGLNDNLVVFGATAFGGVTFGDVAVLTLATHPSRIGLSGNIEINDQTDSLFGVPIELADLDILGPGSTISPGVIVPMSVSTSFDVIGEFSIGSIHANNATVTLEGDLAAGDVNVSGTSLTVTGRLRTSEFVLTNGSTLTHAAETTQEIEQ